MEPCQSPGVCWCSPGDTNFEHNVAWPVHFPANNRIFFAPTVDANKVKFPKYLGQVADEDTVIIRVGVFWAPLAVDKDTLGLLILNSLQETVVDHAALENPQFYVVEILGIQVCHPLHNSTIKIFNMISLHHIDKAQLFQASNKFIQVNVNVDVHKLFHGGIGNSM